MLWWLPVSLPFGFLFVINPKNMAKKRYINTKFWSDNFVVDLNPLERYLFLYLLTNEHTDICGIYELSWRVMERETGLPAVELSEMFTRLKGKIFYIDGWVYLKNFAKHQAVNPKVSEGIDRSRKLVPQLILDKINRLDIDYDSLSIDYELPIPKPTPKLKPKPNGNTASKKKSVSDNIESDPDSQLSVKDQDSLISNQVASVIDAFRDINPTINFGNKTQRRASEGLIKLFGIDKVLATIAYYKTIHGEKYAPVITNPYQLQEKMGVLLAFYKKEHNKNVREIPKI